MGRTAGHTHYPKGQRLLVILRDGRRFIDKFVDRNATGMVLENFGRLAICDLRVATPFKGRDDRATPSRGEPR